jgi:hypothetical protein
LRANTPVILLYSQKTIHEIPVQGMLQKDTVRYNP